LLDISTARRRGQTQARANAGAGKRSVVIADVIEAAAKRLLSKGLINDALKICHAKN